MSSQLLQLLLVLQLVLLEMLLQRKSRLSSQSSSRLKEAKDLCENGGNLKEGVSKEEAASMKEKLEAAGCVIEVK